MQYVVRRAAWWAGLIPAVLVVASAFVAFGVDVSVGAVDVAEAADVSSEPLTVRDIPGTDLSIGAPSSWEVVREFPSLDPAQLRDYLKTAYPEAARMTDEQILAFVKKVEKSRPLTVADVRGDGDNVTVAIDRGGWYSGLAEWQALGRLSAKSTDAVVLDDHRARVGSQPAFVHVEQDPPSGSGDIFVYMEVRQDRRHTVAISITVDGRSRATADAIVGSVTETHH